MGAIFPLHWLRDMKETIEFHRNALGFEMGMIFPAADNPDEPFGIRDFTVEDINGHQPAFCKRLQGRLEGK